ncbi:MAG: alpha/beta hydrolase [Acidobacteria bacterium]|nr:alpha/beta hydrolase [Acidobacteriota bacterium]MBV9474819.1 alpha/beta hydrolase [Acidobacteriota bacterium]
MSRSLLALVLLACATAASAGTFTTYESLEYANVGGTSLQLDLRVPDGAGPHPVILYLHSGAWITGDRTGGPALRQATRGYAVASIDYRLAPAWTWPSQIEDCKAAVRWLRANAARFHLDPNRIGVFGTSAGGHLAAVLGTSGGVDTLEGLSLGNPQFSSRVKAVVDLYGPTDLLKLEEQKLPCIPLDGNASFMPPSLLMGCAIQSVVPRGDDDGEPDDVHHARRPAVPHRARPARLPGLVQAERRSRYRAARRRRGVAADPDPERRPRRQSVR